jgi:hypothetical protein
MSGSNLGIVDKPFRFRRRDKGLLSQTVILMCCSPWMLTIISGDTAEMLPSLIPCVKRAAISRGFPGLNTNSEKISREMKPFWKDE